MDGQMVLGVFGEVFGTLVLGTYQEKKSLCPLHKQWGWGGMIGRSVIREQTPKCAIQFLHTSPPASGNPAVPATCMAPTPSSGTVPAPMALTTAPKPQFQGYM